VGEGGEEKMSAGMTPVEIIDEMLRWAEEREQEKKKLEERERKAKERKENATKQKPMKLKEKIALMEAAAKVADFWEVDAADLVSWVAIKRPDKIAEWNEIANEVSSFYESMLSELEEIKKERQKNKEAREK
jgi:FtsZ-interacting cell division protein YlmF